MRELHGSGGVGALRVRNLLVCVAMLLLAACHASVHEHHYFASYPEGDASKPPVNYFRVTVDGESQWSDSRYLAGFYDERAVDLFFSELKGNQTLFKADMKNPGTQEVLKPLDPGANGAFVIILSTNADSIAQTIGAFAESEVVGSAVTQLANRSELKAVAESNAGASATKTSASAFTDELKSRLGVAGSATDAASAEAAYLQAVNLVARELGQVKGFATLDEALTWLQGKMSP